MERRPPPLQKKGEKRPYTTAVHAGRASQKKLSNRYTRTVVKDKEKKGGEEMNVPPASLSNCPESSKNSPLPSNGQRKE